MKLLNEIAAKHHLHINTVNRLSGGDINDVFLLSGSDGAYVAKMNSAIKFPMMFEAEKRGLELLVETEAFRIPKTLATGILNDHSYLLLEFIEEGSPKSNFWLDFGYKLALLHQCGNPLFGLDHNNYIGSLVQQNLQCHSAAEFYVSQRLKPQFDLALSNGYQFEDLDRFYNSVSRIVPNEPPSLLHGDLWGGNYLVDNTGQPVLIDPAVAYGSREMDIAMMQLFGGFSTEIFDAYNETFPMQTGWQERIKVWQLYYLLVHLNIFGAGYFSQVKAAMKPYY